MFLQIVGKTAEPILDLKNVLGSSQVTLKNTGRPSFFLFKNKLKKHIITFFFHKDAQAAFKKKDNVSETKTIRFLNIMMRRSNEGCGELWASKGYYGQM